MFAMLRVKRYSTLFRDARRFCSSAFEEQWIQRTFFQHTSTTPTLAPPDLIINSPTLNRKQIDEFSNQSNCIIDTHNKVMGLPLIDFDVQKYCDAIEEASLISPDLDRTKPLFGMVRGMGGGKTRSLEEIRRLLLMKSDTLPLAITFNASWDLHNDRWESYLRPRHPCDHRLHLTLAIISRMASMLYNKPFRDIVTAIIQNINSILQSNRNASIAEYLLCAFIKCAVEDVSRHRDRPITKFVLLIDETMKLVEHIEKVYECNVDVMSMVRDVLLTDVHTVHTKEGQAYELNVALVISSLNIRPLGMTTSGRPVKPIHLPNYLNSARVCNEIFLKHPHTLNLSVVDRLTFQLIAASLNELPRLVEYANEYISENTFPQHEENLPHKENRRTYFSKLYEYVCDRVRSMYSTQIQNGLILYSIVFGVEINVIEPVFNAITYSLITNSISRFSILMPTSLVPNGSLLMLYEGSRESAWLAYLHEPLQAIFGVIEKSTDAGKVLEDLMLEWLRVRLRVAAAALEYEKQDVEVIMPCSSPYHFSVRMLLNLNPRVGMYHLGLLNRPLNIKYYLDTSAIVFNDTINSEKFVNELISCKVDEYYPIAILKSGKRDAWDVGLKVFDAKDTANPLFIFIDCTSVNGSLKEKKTKLVYNSVTDLPKRGKRYNSMKAFCEHHKLRFLYIYFSTRDVDGWKISENSEGNLIVMGQDESKSFLGPIFQLYAAARLAKTQKQ